FLTLTLRSEELHRCAEAGLSNIVTDSAFLLGPLDDEEQRREIITAPARAVLTDWVEDSTRGWLHGCAPFQPEVVDALMGESRRVLNGPGHRSDHLPLLQHALLRIWDVAAERWSLEIAKTDGELSELCITVADLVRTVGDTTPGFFVRCL